MKGITQKIWGTNWRKTRRTGKIFYGLMFSLIVGTFFLGDSALNSGVLGSNSSPNGSGKTQQDYFDEGQNYQGNIVQKPALDDSINIELQNGNIPNYPKDPIALKNQAEEKIHSDQGTDDPGVQAGQFVKSSDDGWIIDPEKDEMILLGEKIAANPEKYIGVIEDATGTEAQGIQENGEEDKSDSHICYEGKASTIEKCHSRLVPKKTETEERKEHIINLLGKDMYSSGVINLPKGPRRPPDADSRNIQIFRSKGSLVDAMSGQDLMIDSNQIVDISFVKQHGQKVTYFYKKEKNSKIWSEGLEYWQYKITTIEKTAVYKLDDWESDCRNLEKRTDKGDCETIEKRCIDPEKTKIIDGKSLTADCWLEERTYQCSSKVTNTCQALRDRGCYQISSKCEAYDENSDAIGEERPCFQWKQTFECAQGGPTKMARITGPAPFCLDGNCNEVSWAPNVDMAESLSKLSVLNAMKGDMDMDKMTVFKGKELKCSRNPAGFKNCCVKKGWGLKVGLAGCNEDEKELSVERAGNKCVIVGTYCKKKEFGVCIDKRTSYCCFGTKLSRILHEQGRKILKMDFGTPRNPNCSGFKMEDFTKLDLSKIDLSELFQEFLSKMKLPDSKGKASQVQSNLGTKEQREEFHEKQTEKKGEL